MILKMLQPIVVIGVLFWKQICQTALGWFSNLHGQISDFHSGFLRSFKNRCLVRYSPIQKRGEKKKERKKNGYERFVSDVKIHGSRECALFESKKFSCATRPPIAFIRRKWEKVSFGEQTGADIDHYATRIEMCLNFPRAPALCTLPLIFLLKYFIHSYRWRIVLIK